MERRKLVIMSNPEPDNIVRDLIKSRAAEVQQGIIILSGGAGISKEQAEAEIKKACEILRAAGIPDPEKVANEVVTSEEFRRDLAKARLSPAPMMPSSMLVSHRRPKNKTKGSNITPKKKKRKR